MLRLNRILVPATLAAGLLLTGCSDEVDGEASPATTGSSSSGSSSSSSSSSSGSSSSTSPSGSGEYEEFCTDGEEAFDEVGVALNAAQGMGVQAYVDALQQAVEAFDAVEAPEEIADDWAASQDGFADLRDTVAAIDPAAPDAEDQAVDIIDEAETTVGPAFERVSEWIDENCENA